MERILIALIDHAEENTGTFPLKKISNDTLKNSVFQVLWCSKNIFNYFTQVVLYLYGIRGIITFNSFHKTLLVETLLPMFYLRELHAIIKCTLKAKLN